MLDCPERSVDGLTPRLTAPSVDKLSVGKESRREEEASPDDECGFVAGAAMISTSLQSLIHSSTCILCKLKDVSVEMLLILEVLYTRSKPMHAVSFLQSIAARE